MDCVVMGDSIAVGIQQHTHCFKQAAIGRSASQQAAMAYKITVDTTVISLGSNNPTHPELLRDLRRIRFLINSRKVIWVIPYHRYAAEAVRRVAAENRDGLLDLANYKTFDKVHPANYREVAREIMREW